MSFIKIIPICASMVGVAGCSMHPLQDDVTRASSVDVVRKIRCEARTAVMTHAVGDDKKNSAEATITLANSIYKRDVEKNKIAATEARRKAIQKVLKPNLQNAAIGYDFKFTISEGDDASGNATLIFPFSNGKAFLGLGLGEDKERKSDRKFIIVDNFWELLAEPKESCSASSESWRYPITGDIGMDEVLGTYVGLLEVKADGALNRRFKKAGKTGGADQSEGDDVEFIDVLTFTTSYDGTVAPSADINPVVHDLRLAKVSASFGGTRKDVHGVTISLVSKYSPRDSAPPASTRGYSSEDLGASRSTAKGMSDLARERLFRHRTEGVFQQLLDDVQK